MWFWGFTDTFDAAYGYARWGSVPIGGGRSVLHEGLLHGIQLRAIPKAPASSVQVESSHVRRGRATHLCVPVAVLSLSCHVQAHAHLPHIIMTAAE